MWIVITSFFVFAIWISRAMASITGWLNLFLSTTVTVILLSVFFFLSLPLNIDFTLLAGISALAGFGALWFKPLRYRISRSGNWLNRYNLLFLLLFLVSLAGFSSFVKKWGEWDAWAIWSAHAGFLTSDDFWKNLWSQPYSWSHNDYPLMLPSLIALVWKETGEVSYIAPMVISFLPLAGIILLLYLSGSNPQTGLFATLLIVVNNRFLFHAASQYADLLLSFVILLFFILNHCIPEDEKSRKTKFVVLGIIASSGFWIKNEGILFFVLATMNILSSRNGRSNFLIFFAGSLLIITLVSAIHFFTMVRNDIISGINADVLGKITDRARYSLIFSYFLNVMVVEFPILPFAWLSIHATRQFREFRPFFTILVPLLLAYLAIYVITPYDQEWHLRTSMNRLILHLYPATIYFFAQSADRISGQFIIKE